MITKTIRKNAVDCFSFLTIASVCMGIFRAKFLTEKWSVLIKDKCKENCKHDRNCVCEWIEGRKLDASSPLEILWEGKWEPRSKFNVIKEKFEKSPIGLIPVHGYGSKDTHSKESIEWMSLLQHQWINKGKPISIQHARTPLGEKVITCQGLKTHVKYKVDGYFEYQGRKYVWEYHGCNFHGCKKCFPHSRETTMNNNTFIAQRWRDTQIKEKRLREQGYIVLSKWSCEFAEERKKPKVRDFLNIINIQDPINLRDCYFGGRTNALVLHKKFLKERKVNM